MGDEPKRRKIEPPRRIPISAAGTEKPFQASHVDNVSFGIQQAKNLAIAQAKQDGCTGNYRIFDSPFANFFIPDCVHMILRSLQEIDKSKGM